METTKKLIEAGEKVTTEWIEEQISWIVKKIEQNMLRFGNDFPSACATNGIYRIKPNDDWTNGFWTGMLWLAYELTNENKFLKQAQENIKSFQKRLDEHFILDHHDIGFLYSLSAGAGYQITGDDACKAQLLQAANLLISRFHEKGNFIQAWGKYGNPKEYRLIIDSLINLPLLFKASELSGNPLYADIATKHYQTLLATVIRADATTHHTYYFDPETGKALYGATHQGNSDTSMWARGQSWAILGIPLNERYVHSIIFPEKYIAVVDIFLKNLPQDLIPYWDFDYTDENPSDKDSSSAAVVACGLLEAEKVQAYPDAKKIAKGLIYQLGENYSTENIPENEGLLLHGVYAHAEGKGVDEPNLWGDYFYLEALMRLKNSNWKRYW